ncbi:hypothetical protein [Bosea sp. (in: a-proteobacteria)]|uniref:hypothetical protein n=1 Tax=Bosea sp. (in: a-proteobacteria) TaxID=1871050 RepID=UPI0025BE456A|nr:hypothetical protein [Bosea sp. (in: a-proteobacteria)]
MTTEQLEAAGKLLLGEEWKRPLAKLLGPYHPQGARESMDPRLPFRWASGERPIPSWVDVVIEMMLERRAQRFVAAAMEARALSEILVDQLKFKHDDEYVRHVQSIMAREAQS